MNQRLGNVFRVWSFLWLSIEKACGLSYYDVIIFHYSVPDGFSNAEVLICKRFGCLYTKEYYIS